ncbi:hypothetical protein M378DRAFT_170014 [Amanita muscaria Koide BX008]|uniref:Uncharacterized protein n=1 Tax=Amanita muscaria (strain Koide BX008) TaxID=946122 RepID=A0A0C2WC98_AMAMK|nr:hypothetical protein M378DRAFT_170014 [Amanita muscaria Koide BX008]
MKLDLLTRSRWNRAGVRSVRTDWETRNGTMQGEAVRTGDQVEVQRVSEREVFSSATLSRGESSLSLTGRRGLHNYVEV